MRSRNELALTVEERTAGQFFWVLIEACETQDSDAFHYRRIECAETAQSVYWDALLLGMAALRRPRPSGGGAQHSTMCAGVRIG